MKINCWLRVVAKANSKGVLMLTGVDINMKKPMAPANSVVMELNLELPDFLFVKPTLQANIIVPDNGHPGPVVITAEMKQSVQEVLIEQFGMFVEVAVKK